MRKNVGNLRRVVSREEAERRQRRRTKKAPPKKKRKYPEYQIQVTLASLLRTHYPDLLWFAIPNGGKRSLRDAKRFKAMGVRAGVLDIFVSEPTPIHPGLYVEMKAPKGKLSEEQIKFRDAALLRGYHCVACESAIDALCEIEMYMGVPQKERVSFQILS